MPKSPRNQYSKNQLYRKIKSLENVIKKAENYYASNAHRHSLLI